MTSNRYVVLNCPAYEYDKDWVQHICKTNLAIYEKKLPLPRLCRLYYKASDRSVQKRSCDKLS